MSNFSKLISLRDVLSGCWLQYCIVKKPASFPNYVSYSDLDIICENRESMCQFILSKLKHREDIEVRVNRNDAEGFTHIDVHRPGFHRLDIKFDLVDSLHTGYKKTNVAESLTSKILENRIGLDGFYFPSMVYEMVVRMLEYREYIQTRPDKIKHLNYVKENLENNPDFNEIWDLYIQEDCFNE